MSDSELHHIVKGNDECCHWVRNQSVTSMAIQGNHSAAFIYPISGSIPQYLPNLGFTWFHNQNNWWICGDPANFWGIPMLTQHRTFIHQALCPAVWVFYDHLSSPDGQCWDGWLACDSRLSRCLLVLQWMYHKIKNKTYLSKKQTKSSLSIGPFVQRSFLQLSHALDPKLHGSFIDETLSRIAGGEEHDGGSLQQLPTIQWGRKWETRNSYIKIPWFFWVEKISFAYFHCHNLGYLTCLEFTQTHGSPFEPDHWHHWSLRDSTGSVLKHLKSLEAMSWRIIHHIITLETEGSSWIFTLEYSNNYIRSWSWYFRNHERHHPKNLWMTVSLWFFQPFAKVPSPSCEVFGLPGFSPPPTWVESNYEYPI